MTGKKKYVINISLDDYETMNNENNIVFTQKEFYEYKNIIADKDNIEIIVQIDDILERPIIMGRFILDDIFYVNYGHEESEEQYLEKYSTLPRFLAVKEIYLRWCSEKNLKPNMNEGWFKSKKFHKYLRNILYTEQNFNYVILGHSFNHNYPTKRDQSENEEGDLNENIRL